MKLHLTAFIGCMTFSTAAVAIQPVDIGLHPLYERIEAICGEQQLLNEKLQAPETSAFDRALSYRRYKVLEVERSQLARDIAQTKKLAKSPLVTFMAPSAEPE